jgi:hypothetical protein
MPQGFSCGDPFAFYFFLEVFGVLKRPWLIGQARDLNLRPQLLLLKIP